MLVFLESESVIYDSLIPLEVVGRGPLAMILLLERLDFLLGGYDFSFLLGRTSDRLFLG